MKRMDIISQSNVKITNTCPECGGHIISVQEMGELVCGQCGLIINEKMIDDSHSDRRSYNSQERANREQVGPPISILVPNIGLTTVIDKGRISNPDLKRAAKWDSRMTWEKRNFLIAKTELMRISSNLNLPHYIKKEAMRLYIESYKRKLLRGRSINGMVAASLYFACRIKMVPRTFQEILDEASVNAKEVRRCYRTLIRELNLKAPPSTNPISLIPKYITDLGLNNEISMETTKILNKFTSSLSLSGKDPKGLCGGALYLVCKIKGINITQREIADTIGITEVTLRSRYKELAKKLNILP